MNTFKDLGRASGFSLGKKLCMNALNPPETKAFCLKYINHFQQKSQGGRENLPPQTWDALKGIQEDPFRVLAWCGLERKNGQRGV